MYTIWHITNVDNTSGVAVTYINHVKMDMPLLICISRMSRNDTLLPVVLLWHGNGHVTGNKFQWRAHFHATDRVIATSLVSKSALVRPGGAVGLL